MTKKKRDPYTIACQLLAVLPDHLRGLPVVELAGRLAPCRHSVDFAGVVWYGQHYSFTATQRHIVKLLWTAWEDGTLDVGQETLLMNAGSEGGRLMDVFRDHPAWGKMIAAGACRGTYRLAEPKPAEGEA